MSISYSFKNKQILVTGVTSGIGQQTSWDLSKADAELVLVGRDKEKFQITQERLKKEVSAKQLTGDMCDTAFLSQVAAQVPSLDGLVLVAGVIDYTPVRLISQEKIRRVFDINFEANVLLIQQLINKKKLNKGASIIFVSSISSKLGVPGTALYAASKAALSSFAKVLASELSPRGIRVNTILPGIVQTSIVSDTGVLDNNELLKHEAVYPLGFGGTKDVSNQILYLLSDASKWVTGTEIIIDGGHTLK